MSISYINKPKVRKSQTHWWIIIGSMPTFRFETFESATIGAHAYYDHQVRQYAQCN